MEERPEEEKDVLNKHNVLHKKLMEDIYKLQQGTHEEKINKTKENLDHLI